MERNGSGLPLPAELVRQVLVQLPLLEPLRALQLVSRQFGGPLCDVQFAHAHIRHQLFSHSDAQTHATFPSHPHPHTHSHSQSRHRRASGRGKGAGVTAGSRAALELPCLFEFLDAIGLRDNEWAALPFSYKAALYAWLLAAPQWAGVELPGATFGADMANNKMWYRRWLMAAPQAHKVVTRLLTFPFFDVAAQNNRCLRWAARSGYTATVRMLLAHPAVDPADDGNYAVYCAAASGELDVVSLLLADDRVDPAADSQLAIQYAAEFGHTAVVKALLAHPRVDPSARDNNCAVRLAADNGHADIVEILLKDPRVNPADSNNYAIILASRNGHTKVVSILLADYRVDCSANLNEAIRDACSNGHTEVTKNTVAKTRNYLIKQRQVIRLLLANPRCDPSAEQNAPIREACSHGHVNAVALLLADGRVDPTIEDQQPIRLAAWQGRSEVVELLLKDMRVDPTRNGNQAFRNALFHAEAEARNNNSNLLDPGDVGVGQNLVDKDKKYFRTLQLLVSDMRVKKMMTDRDWEDVERVLALFCKAVEFANICLRDLSSLRLSRNVGAMRNVVSRMGYVSPKRQRMINRHPTKGLEIESAVNSQIESVLRNGKKWKKCRGCAAPIQCIDANKPGFIPAELLIGNSGSRVPSVHTRALTAIPVEAKLPEMGFNPQQLMILVDEVAERAKKKRKEEKLVCQRCHSLIHYNTNTSNVISVDAAASLIDKHLVSAPAVAVVVIDAADLPFSLPPTSLLRNVNPSAQIFALNKIDLLSSIHEKPDIINERMVKVQKYVSKMIFPYTSAKIIPISARSGFGLMELVDAINSSHESLLAADKSSPNLSNNQVLPNITFLGRPNTGKSKLINILSEMSSDVRFPRQHNTSSIHPGTTIGLIPRPLSQFYLLAQLCTQENSKKQFVYDTPGLFHPDQITQHMSTAELSTSIPCKPFQPKAAIKLAPGTSMFVGALLRIDCVLRDAPPAVFRIRNFIEPVGDNKKKRTHEEKLVGSLTSKGFYRNSEVFISAYIANLIPLHKCRTERAAELFDKAGSYPDIMYPPIGADRAKIFGEMKYVERFRGDQFGSGKAIDIAIGGVGWVTLRNIPQNYDFDVWVLGTSGSAVIRESIIG